MQIVRVVPLTARQFLLAIRLWVDLRGGQGALINNILGHEPMMLATDLWELLAWEVVVRVKEETGSTPLRPGYPHVYLSEWFDLKGRRELEQLLGHKVELQHTYDLGVIARNVISQTRGMLLSRIRQLTSGRYPYLGEPEQQWVLGEINHNRWLITLFEELASHNRRVQVRVSEAYRTLERSGPDLSDTDTTIE